MTALIYAGREGHSEVLKTLISSEARLDDQDSKGYTVRTGVYVLSSRNYQPLFSS